MNKEEMMSIIDSICQKYGYSDKDETGNDSLKTVLKKAIPIMLENRSQEDQTTFFEMLQNTPIVITENLTQEGYKEIFNKYIGENLNPHIVEEKADYGEYGKELGAGAFITEPILDENLQIKGKKSFIYIQKVNEKSKEILGTDINVAHLIHELGHAWNAEKNPYTFEENGTMHIRTGFADLPYTFSKLPNGQFKSCPQNPKGLMIEESMNTILEEDTLAKYIGVSQEEIIGIYRNTLIPSNYQGYITAFMRYALDKIGKEDLQNYRMTGDPALLEKINTTMEKTEYWKNREKDITSEDSPRNYDKKKEIINRPCHFENKIKEFFKKYESIYFPNISQMTPIEKINNVLEQVFNMKEIKYSIEIENYRDFMDGLGYEGYSLINQTAEIKEKENAKDETQPISIKSALTNALRNSTITTSKIQEAQNVEKTQQNEKQQEEEGGPEING